MSIAVITLPRIDVFALLILAGALQGMFLCLMFFRKERKIQTANFYLGLLILAMTLCILEIFLNYTGLMLKVLWLDNFSEPFIFLLGPSVFLYATSLMHIRQKRPWIHFLWFGAYCLYHVFYLIQPTDIKFNFLNELYDFGLPMRSWNVYFSPDPLYLRRYVNEILALHWVTYIIISSYFVVKAYQKEGISIFSSAESKNKWLRNMHFHLWISFIIFVVVKLTYGRDLGDYLVAVYMAGCIYLISFNVVKNSVFFKPEPVQAGDMPKYQKSSLTDQDKSSIRQKLEQSLIVDKCFTNNLLSLSDLARRVGVPSHHLSQVINESYQKTFFEYIAQHRINEAKELLSGQSDTLTVEEIAEQVGYNSKSAFNKAFKKFTNCTPSEYRENTKK